jgi:hypothetical protein
VNVIGGDGSTVGPAVAVGENAGDTEPEEPEECPAVDTYAVRAGHDLAPGSVLPIIQTPAPFSEDHHLAVRSRSLAEAVAVAVACRWLLERFGTCP